MAETAAPAGEGGQVKQIEELLGSQGPQDKEGLKRGLKRTKDRAARKRVQKEHGNGRAGSIDDEGTEHRGQEASAGEADGRDTGERADDGPGPDGRAEDHGDARQERPGEPSGEAEEGPGAGSEEGRSLAAIRESLNSEEGLTLRELGKGLGLGADHLYKTQIPLDDGTGETISIEEMRERYKAGEAGQLGKEQHAFRAEQARFEQSRIEHEGRVMAAQQDVSDVLGVLQADGKITPELFRALKDKAEQQRDAERGKLVELMPQLRDPVAYQGWRKDVYENLLRPAGLPMAVLDQIAHHRIFKLLDNDLRRLKRIRALEDVKGDPPEPGKTVKRTGARKGAKPRPKRRDARRAEDRQLDEIESLI